MAESSRSPRGVVGFASFPAPLQEALADAAARGNLSWAVEADGEVVQITLRAGAPVDPLDAARARGDRARHAVLERHGATLSAEQVGERLGMSRQAVDKRRVGGRLLAVEHGPRGYRYPAWQVADGAVIDGLEDALAALGPRDPWSALLYFVTPSDALGGQTPRAALERGGRAAVAAVVRAAVGWMDHGAP